MNCLDCGQAKAPHELHNGTHCIRCVGELCDILVAAIRECKQSLDTTAFATEEDALGVLANIETDLRDAERAITHSRWPAS